MAYWCPGIINIGMPGFRRSHRRNVLSTDPVTIWLSLYLFQSSVKTSPSCAGAIWCIDRGELVSQIRTVPSPEAEAKTVSFRAPYSLVYGMYARHTSLLIVVMLEKIALSYGPRTQWQIGLFYEIPRTPTLQFGARATVQLENCPFCQVEQLHTTSPLALTTWFAFDSFQAHHTTHLGVERTQNLSLRRARHFLYNKLPLF